MNQTALFVVGSIILIAFTIIVAVPYISPKQPGVPVSYPADIEASQTVKCIHYSHVVARDYEYYIPDEYKLYVTIYGKSYSKTPIYIDKMIPFKEENKTLQISTVVRPQDTIIKTFQAPWGPVTKLTGRVSPGDVVEVKGMNLKLESIGTIYSSIAPLRNDGQVGNDFECPFNGSKHYNLTIDGEKISSKIREPGCAGIILSHLPYLGKYLVLADYKPGEYYYNNSDIQFFLQVYKSPSDRIGVYRYPAKTGLLYGEANQTITTKDTDYQALALWYDGSMGDLYLNNNNTAVMRTGTINVRTGDLVLGVAREKFAHTAPEIKICAYYNEYSNKHHCITFDPQLLTYKITKDGNVIKSGQLPVLTDGDDIQDVLRNNGIFVYFNPHPGSSHLAEFTYKGKVRKWYMPNLGDADMDMIIVWEDLVGYYSPGDSGIDGDGDEWIHVTYFHNGTWRIAGYLAKGAFEHDFYIANHLIFTKDFNDNWNNKINGIHYEYTANFFPVYYNYPFHEAPLSSYVRYVGLFTDRTLTIKGLAGGDKVILSAGGVMDTYVASNSTLTIDLLYDFTPQQLVTAMEEGGILLTIIPSAEHLLNFIPTHAKVHIYDELHDMWIDVYMPVKTECNSTLLVKSTGMDYTTIIDSSDYEIWRITFNDRTLGAYPKVDVTVLNGKVTILSKYGVYTYKAPSNDGSTVKITTVPPNYIGVMVGMKMTPIPYVYKIIIKGTLYGMIFGYGK